MNKEGLHLSDPFIKSGFIFGRHVHQLSLNPLQILDIRPLAYNLGLTDYPGNIGLHHLCKWPWNGCDLEFAEVIAQESITKVKEKQSTGKQR